MKNRFETASTDLSLYLNLRRDSKIVNRIRKLIRHPLKYLSHFLYKLGMLPGADRTILTCFGSRMTIPLWDQNAVILFYTGTLAPEELSMTRYLQQILTKNDVFFDIGANLGYFSSLATACGASVHAFEPNGKLLPYLRENAGAEAVIISSAISDRVGTAEFFDTSETGKSGTSSLLRPKGSSLSLSIPVTTLDVYCERAEVPTVIKIDVEGAEERVLAGARAMLIAHRPIILMEVLKGERDAASQRAIGYLTDASYEAHGIAADGSLIPYTPDALNLVFIKKRS